MKDDARVELKVHRCSVRPSDRHHLFGRIWPSIPIDRGAAIRRADGQMAGFMEQISGKAQTLHVYHDAAMAKQNTGKEGRFGQCIYLDRYADVTQECDNCGGG